jgi:hypothetical protein
LANRNYVHGRGLVAVFRRGARTGWMSNNKEEKRAGLGKAIGLGLITGAADDDPSAIGTYASAGAQFGTLILWVAPIVLPMMFTGRLSFRGHDEIDFRRPTFLPIDRLPTAAGAP